MKKQEKHKTNKNIKSDRKQNRTKITEEIMMKTKTNMNIHQKQHKQERATKRQNQTRTNR